MTPPKSTQAQIDAIAIALAALTERVDQESRVRDENHAMLTALHSALMVPQPGQDGVSLLDRMAAVTVNVESGKRVADGAVTLAKWFAAIGAIVGLFASVKFGFWTKI